MTTAVARSTFWKTAFDRHPFLGFYASLDTLGMAATAATDISEFGHSGFGTGHFKDHYFWRYNLTTGDRISQATTVVGSTGVLSLGKTNADTTDLDYALTPIHPDTIINSLVSATREMQLQTLVSLNGGTDFDMETAGVTYWDGNAGNSTTPVNITVTKSTTDVYSGTQSTKLTATGVSGVVRGERIRAQAGKQFYSAAIARADVGTLGFGWYNVTGAAVITSPAVITTISEDWVLLECSGTVPTGCEEMQPYFTLSGASDIAYIDTIFGPYWQGRTVYNLQPYMDEVYKIKALRMSRYGTSIADRVYDAYSRSWTGDWLQPDDFEAELFHREVNRYRVQLKRNEDFNGPVWISAERTLHDVEPLATEAATTTAPFEELFSRFMANLLTEIVEGHGHTEYAALLADYRLKSAVEDVVRPSLPVEPRRKRTVWVA